MDSFLGVSLKDHGEIILNKHAIGLGTMSHKLS